MDHGFSLRFGIDGNAAENLGAGWSRPEPGFTWTLGHQSTLLLPAPLTPTALSLSLRAHPFTPAARPFQRVTARIGDTVLGRMLFTEPDDLRLVIPPDLAVGLREGIELSLDLPDAGRPCEFDGNDDTRVLGLSCRRLNIAELPMLDGNGDVPLADIAGNMQSLGFNCEFGLVQRRAGAEPLGLLRFATSPLPALLAGLGARFDGIGDPAWMDLTEVPFAPGSNSCEWIVRDRRFGFVFHTWIRTSEASRDEIERLFSRRLGFLARKLVEDLEDAEKLFVYQDRTIAAPQQGEALLRALRRYGDNRLLLVMADPSRVGEIAPGPDGLLLGFVGRLTETGAANRFDWPDWSRLLRRVHQVSLH